MSPDEPPPAENRPPEPDTTGATIRLPLRAEHVSVTKRERVRREPLPQAARPAAPSPRREPESRTPADLETTQPLGPPEARGTLSPTGMEQEPIE